MKSSQISRRFILAGLMAGVADVALGDAPLRSIRPEARRGVVDRAEARRRSAASAEGLISAAKLGGKVGFVVADAKTGKVLESFNPDVALPPASVAKSVTAAYALEALGPGYRFVTRVVATGPISGGTIAGDLVLVGGGDPTLSTDHLADMAKALKAAGVRRVAGRVRAYAGALPHVHDIDSSQPDYVGYNPSFSGLNLNYNRVHFEWRRSGNGFSVAMDARSDSYRPPVSIASMAIQNREGNLFTYRDADGRDQWTVRRNALGNGGSRWLPVRRPADYAMEVFRYFLRAQGIEGEIGADVRTLPKGAILAQHQSPDLRRICRDMLLYSTNLTAEIVGMTASVAGGSRKMSVRASARKMTGWLKSRTGASKPSFVDHSGLGDSSRISAADMTEMVRRLGPRVGLRGILKTVPLRNSAGKVIPSSRVEILAKTGTLNFVSALSGYIRTSDGRDLVFTIFTGDTARRASIPKAQREAPQGAAQWNTSAKNLQMRLIERWDQVHGA
ncbi:D-alanyl-D-alanine carboxypeptidase/D-alanyl-D-alanine-endopeptidase [Alphaproteobacteria bacterium KMM 3653]|uniref:D-alanyl-D-alanine carboxypeptidase/D-alanyl-D-alanine-endopeptidase n=1 Tax=Harenicola maris TaxID=2841044 RepID=A0AAP2G6K7_9RHOB|nr:D-alanyl-D-alanine carboxypeptidase/D-alanyl-D-alanine-endopeptidase [Harenicola maris]